MQPRSTRFLAALPADILEDGLTYSCEALNLHREGVLLRGALPVPESRDIKVSIRSPAGDLVLHASGKIAHSKVVDGTREIGIKLNELTERQLQILESLISRVVEGMNPASLKNLTPGSTPAEIRLELEKIPVAHRISLAKRAMTQERAFLKHDSNPKVMESLARNPNTNIREIKELARFHEHLPTTLDFIARDARWARDDELRLIVATHPRVSLDTAERLVDAMDPRQRQKALESPGLNPVLRRKLVQRYNPR